MGRERPERFLENFLLLYKIEFWKAVKNCLEIIYMRGTKCLLHQIWSVRDMEPELRGTLEVAAQEFGN